MSTIRRILFATDFSDAAKSAYKYAINLATDLNAEIIVLHAFKVSAGTMPDTGSELPAEIESGIEERLLDQLNKFARSIDTRSVEISTEIVEGVPYVEITNEAVERNADLVIVGTHGRTGIAHILLGSVAERVVRTSKVPVLTIPNCD